jgi:hypothetical protein
MHPEHVHIGKRKRETMENKGQLPFVCAIAFFWFITGCRKGGLDYSNQLHKLGCDKALQNRGRQTCRNLDKDRAGD